MTDALETVLDQTDILAHLFFASGTADLVAVSTPEGSFEGTFCLPEGQRVLLSILGLAPRLAPGVPVRVRYSGLDDTYGFESEVVAVEAQAVQIDLPRAIERTDRRLTTRVPLSASHNVGIVILERPNLPRCPVRDLSAGGVGFVMATAMGELFHEEQVVTARIEIPGEAPLPVELELRHIEPGNPDLRVGARFAAMFPGDRERLCRWLLKAL